MFYKMTTMKDGDYIDAEGNRYRLAECNKVATPDGFNVGYSEFETKEECLATWGLSYSPAPPPARGIEYDQ